MKKKSIYKRGANIRKSIKKEEFVCGKNPNKCQFLSHFFAEDAKCELFDNILDKYSKGRLMVKKCFVLHEEVLCFFHGKITFPQ